MRPSRCVLRMKGLEAFRLFKEIDGKARAELISITNSPLDAEERSENGLKASTRAQGLDSCRT